MDTAIIEIITQGGAVGVFAVFAWWLVKEQRKERESNSKVWMEYLRERNGKTEKYMEAQTKATNTLTDYIKELRYEKK